MTMKVVYGTWTIAPSWSTALASVAASSTSTSGQIDNSSTASHHGLEVSMDYHLDGAGTSPCVLNLLAEGNDGAAKDESVPPQGGRQIMAPPQNGSTEETKVVRIYDLPEKFKFHIDNKDAGQGLGANSEVYYRFIDFNDV